MARFIKIHEGQYNETLLNVDHVSEVVKGFGNDGKVSYLAVWTTTGKEALTVDGHAACSKFLNDLATAAS